jgi:hypothetical protein
MSSPDIFGYNRNVHTKSILSSENCVLDFGQGKVSLIQSAALSYQHMVTPQFETGSSDIYFVNGGAQGALQFSSLVGRNGFFNGFELGSQACGDLNTLSITAVGDSNCDFKVEKNNAVRIEGAILESVTLSFQAGTFTVTQGGQFKVGKVIVTSS